MMREELKRCHAVGALLLLMPPASSAWMTMLDRHCLLCMEEALLTTPAVLTRLDHLKDQS